MSITFKKAILEDLEFITEVYNSIIPGGQVTADLEPICVEDWTPWFHQHSSDLRPIWILNDNDKPFGWMSFTDYKARCAYDTTAEISIYLHENFRGKGLGKKSIVQALAIMKERGLKNVLAIIYLQNKPSVQLFRDLNFEQWGLLPKVCEVKGEEKDVVILGMRL